MTNGAQHDFDQDAAAYHCVWSASICRSVVEKTATDALCIISASTLMEITVLLSSSLIPQYLWILTVHPHLKVHSQTSFTTVVVSIKTMTSHQSTTVVGVKNQFYTVVSSVMWLSTPWLSLSTPTCLSSIVQYPFSPDMWAQAEFFYVENMSHKLVLTKVLGQDSVWMACLSAHTHTHTHTHTHITHTHTYVCMCTICNA